MLKSIKMAALAAAVSLTGAAYSTPSSAQDVEFLVGPDGVRIRTADFCDRNPRDRRCRAYFDRNDRHQFRREPQREGRYGRRCDAEDALSKARYMGIRRGDVVRVSERSIAVQGVSRGDRVRVRFSRDGNCSVIG